MRVNIVIPVYNTESIIVDLVKNIIDETSNLKNIQSYKIILVNDCSKDASWSKIKSLCQNNKSILGINLMKNYGQHNALIAGLNYIDGDYIITMDDDFQHSPKEIKNLIGKVDEGFDVCYTKYNENKYSFLKVLGSKINNKLSNFLIDKPKDIYLSSFKCMTKKIASEIRKYDGPYVYLDGLIFDITKNVTSINIEHQKRKEGNSNYNFVKLFTLWLRVLTSFSIAPLRMLTFLGFLMVFLSTLVIIIIITLKLLNPDIAAGWSSLATLIVFFSGLQFVATGLIGEYIGRSYIKINKKPQYVIREIIKENNIDEK